MTENSMYENKGSQSKQSGDRVPKFVGIIFQMIDVCFYIIESPSMFLRTHAIKILLAGVLTTALC